MSLSIWKKLAACSAVAVLAIATGCQRGMYDQPRYDALEESEFAPFEDGRASRDPVPGTIARGQLRIDEHMFAGRNGQEFVRQFPQQIVVDEALLERGEQRFNIYCTVCHAYDGQGDGMAVRRGFKRPPSLHEQRLRDMPEGHFFDVITRGFGQMPSYAAQIRPEDRWAIVAYIRVLQTTRNFDLNSLTSEERAMIEKDRASLEQSQEAR